MEEFKIRNYFLVILLYLNFVIQHIFFFLNILVIILSLLIYFESLEILFLIIFWLYGWWTLIIRIIEHVIMRNKSDYCTLNVFNYIDNYSISNKIIKCCATKTKSRNIVLRMPVHKNLNLYNRERYRKLTREFFLVPCKRETYYLHAC